MTFEQVVSKLKAMSPEQRAAIAQRAKVPVSTVSKITYAHTPNPGVLTVERLAKALKQ